MRPWQKSAVFVLVAALGAGAQTAPPQKASVATRPVIAGRGAQPASDLAAARGAPAAKPAKAKKSAKVVAPATPLPPPTPEQMPPTRPLIGYRNGQLSISANNSTLAEVLNSVRAQTGAAIESTGLQSSDRVVAKLGPGAPKDVLVALLEGSRFNYVILGSDTVPGAVARVVLMPRPGAAGGPVGRPGAGYGAAAARPQPPPPDEEIEEEMMPAEEQPPEVQEEAPPQPDQPQAQPQPADPNNPQVKTPEQLLQELQQMQQQQQQQQQEQQRQNLNGQQPPPQQQIPDREIPDEQPPQ